MSEEMFIMQKIGQWELMQTYNKMHASFKV